MQKVVLPGRLKVAFGLNLFVAFVSSLLGVLYLFSSEITYYHKEIIGVAWETLAPGVQTLLIILLKGTGDAALVTGVTIAILTFIPFRRQREPWSRWAILLIGLTFLLPMLIGAVYLAITTGAPSPWWLNATLIASLFIAFFLSGKLQNPS